jgi:hypothetical protein
MVYRLCRACYVDKLPSEMSTMYIERRNLTNWDAWPKTSRNWSTARSSSSDHVCGMALVSTIVNPTFHGTQSSNCTIESSLNEVDGNTSMRTIDSNLLHKERNVCQSIGYCCIYASWT